MRPRQVACGFGRDYPGKYEDSPYPQWMKTLEEKYQRLHQKVIFNSGQYLSRRASLLSRVRPTPRIAWHTGSTRKSSFTTESAKRCESRLGHHRQEKRDSTAKEEKPPQAEGDTLPLPVVVDDDVNNDNVVDDMNDEDEDFEGDPNGNTEVTINERDETCEIIIHEPDGHRVTIVHNAKENALDVMEGPRVRKSSKARNVKTSVSRTSHKTSKSCPAIIERPMGRPGDQKATSKSKEKKPFKVYTGMSQEARHVINETLKERGVGLVAMNKIGEFLKGETPRAFTINRADQGARNDERVSYVPLASGGFRSRTNSQSGDAANRKDSTRALARKANGVDVTTLFDKRIRFRCEADQTSLLSGRPSKNCIAGDQVEVLSVSAKSSDKSCCDPRDRKPPKYPSGNISRFPSIETDSHGKVLTLQQLQNMNYRVPGVGRYDIPFQREETFEITFPDFDIRYREIIPAERPLSETPPPEIKNRAIAKCQEWLSKYTPR